MDKIQRVLLILLCVLFCGSSACGGIRIPDIRDYRAVEGAERAEILETLKNWSLLPNAYRAGLNVQVSAGIERQQIRQAVVFEAPGNLRIDTFATSFNRLLSLVIVSEKAFLAIDTDKQVAYVGTNSPRNIAVLTHLPLREREYASWLRGRYPGDFSEGEVRVFQKRLSSPEIALEQEFPDGRKLRSYLRMNVQGEPSMRFLEILYPGPEGKTAKVLGEYVYEKGESSCGPGFPSQLKFSLSTVSVSGTLKCESYEENPDLSETRERLFKLRPQSLSNLQVQHLD